MEKLNVIQLLKENDLYDNMEVVQNICGVDGCWYKCLVSKDYKEEVVDYLESVDYELADFDELPSEGVYLVYNSTNIKDLEVVRKYSVENDIVFYKDVLQQAADAYLAE